MRIQTILNRVEKFKSFVYGEANLEERADGPAMVVQMVARKNSQVFCSGCGRPGPAYDRLEERRFEFVPIWGILGVPGLSDASGELQTQGKRVNMQCYDNCGYRNSLSSAPKPNTICT